MKINEIQDLIKFVAKSGVSEVELETDGFKIVIRTPGARKGSESQQSFIQNPMPVQTLPGIPVTQASQVAMPSAPVTSVEKGGDGGAGEEGKYVTIKSPMIGTFYRKPSPDKALFVNVGDSIKKGQTVCIIEAMKLFNEIESEISGKIVKVLVEDNSPVEYDQPLFLVDPS